MTDTQAPQLRLDKLPPIPDRPRLKLADYLAVVPDHPIVDAAPALDYPMDGNDQWGDCEVASEDHAFQAIHTQLVGPYTNWTTDQIVAFFKTQNPSFDPASDAGDNGMVVQVFLEYLRKQGLIYAFAQVDHTNVEEVKAAAYLFLAVSCGAELTQANMDQFNAGLSWDVVAGSQQIGGHAFPMVGYSADGIDVVTWAKVQPASLAFLAQQIDEIWVTITPDHWANPTFRAGLDIAKLAADFQAITGQPLPVPPPPPPTDPDQALAAVAHRWVREHHVGENHHMVVALKNWLTAKNL